MRRIDHTSSFFKPDDDLSTPSFMVVSCEGWIYNELVYVWRETKLSHKVSVRSSRDKLC